MILALRSLRFVFLWCVLGEWGQAADWHQFRGPTGDGHAAATNLPTTWDENTNVAWKAALPGKGWSSPSLVGDRLYLTAAVPKDGDESGPQTLRALCVDANDGRVVWDIALFEQPGKQAIHAKNSHASPTPWVEGGRVYVHFGPHGTACLDINGQVIWKEIAHAYEPVHGNGGSPVLVDGLLVYSCDGASEPIVLALDAATGKERWRFERHSDSKNKFAFSTPTVIEINGQKQIISPGAGVVNALEPATGRELWQVRYGDGYSVIPKPLFVHGMLYVATGYNQPAVMAIRPQGASGDVTESHVVWTTKKSAPHTPSLLIVGDELYMVSDKGVASCLDAHTGSEHWTQRIGGGYSASPLFADGKIYIQSEEGPALVLLPEKKFTKLADTGFKERTLASYAVGNSCLFIRTESHLYRVQQLP